MAIIASATNCRSGVRAGADFTIRARAIASSSTRLAAFFLATVESDVGFGRELFVGVAIYLGASPRPFVCDGYVWHALGCGRPFWSGVAIARDPPRARIPNKDRILVLSIVASVRCRVVFLYEPLLARYRAMAVFRTMGEIRTCGRSAIVRSASMPLASWWVSLPTHPFWEAAVLADCCGEAR